MLQRQWVDAISPELIVELTTDMIRIPTRNPPGEEKACAEYIFDKLTRWGIETELVESPDSNRPQVVGWYRGSGAGPTLIVNGHVDTVTEGDGKQWRHPPFEPVQDGDRLYGLGAADMKGGLAIAMAVLKTLHDSRVALPGTLLFQAVMGEEMDEPGTKTLLQAGYVGDYAIVLEPTSMRVGVGTRGACWHEITLSGPQTHCGLTQADDPDLSHFVSVFMESVRHYHRRISQTRHPLFPAPACRITKLAAGERHNSTAGSGMLLIDRRMLPGETYEQVTGELQQLLEQTRRQVPGIEYALRFVEGNEPTEVDYEGPLCTAIRRGFKDTLGVDAEPWGPPYGSDVRNFIAGRGIEAVNFGPGDFSVCHQPNEYVSVTELHRCARVVMAAAVDILSGK